MNPINLVSSSDLENKNVVDSLGHEFGRVKDVILDPKTSRALLLVVSQGGFVGTDLGSDSLVVPWHKVQVNPNTLTCLLNLNRETVDQAPKVTYSDLLEGDYETLEKVFSYYGYPEHWEDENRKLENIKSPEVVRDQHDTVQGADQETKDAPEENSKLSQEMDFDKLTGKKDK